MTYFIYCLSGSSIDHTEEFVGQCTKIRVAKTAQIPDSFSRSSEVVGGSMDKGQWTKRSARSMQ